MAKPLSYEQRLEAFRQYLRRVEYLKYTLNSLVYWDKITMMPERGLQYRSEVMGFLGGELYRLYAAPELHEHVAFFERNAGQDPLVAAMARRTKRNYYFVNQIPEAEYSAYILLIAKAEAVWEKARKAQDFSLFAPYLEQIVETFRSFAEYWGYEEDPYDALIGYYEEGVTTRQMADMSARLKAFLVPLLQKIRQRPPEPEEAYLRAAPFPKEAQRDMSRWLLETIGFDFAAGRLDESTHPTTLASSPDDVRVVTSYSEDDFRTALFNILHEGGKGLYEQDIDKGLLGTMLAEVASMGLEEAQARLYENMIGRCRGFWRLCYPKLQSYYPALQGLPEDDFYRSVNRVQPSLIRLDADELTYTLHIIIRFELERELVNGGLTVAQLPEEWNRRYAQYLGVTPQNDSEGVLQDIHWAGGYFGFFPSYLLANLYAAQFLNCMEDELGGLDDLIAEGGLEQIHHWLRDNVHSYGARYTPDELVRRVSGEALRPEYYMDYLQKKYGELYK